MADHDTSPAHEVIAITGAAGKIGRLLRSRLARPNRLLRLLDVQHIDEPRAHEVLDIHHTSITDLRDLTRVFTGAQAVVHLAGQSYESDLDDILNTNLRGTYCVLEAARRAGVTRVLLASSHHAAGFHLVEDAGAEIAADVVGRPDTLYGWSKVAGESLGRLYADRFGMNIICLRIGSCTPKPTDERSLALWLSPDDAARLVEAGIRTTVSGYRVLWGISRNTRRYLSLAAGESIGYVPVDDAESYASDIAIRQAHPYQETGPVLQRIGGSWCVAPLGQSNQT